MGRFVRRLITVVIWFLVAALIAVGFVTWRQGWDLHDWQAQGEKLLGPGTLGGPTSAPTPTPAGPGLPTPAPPTPGLQPITADSAAAVDTATVEAALAGAVTPDRRRNLGRRVGIWVGTLDGQPLYTSGPAAVTPASTTKLLTTSAALLAMKPETRFTTDTFLADAAQSGRAVPTVILRGGGDPYLERKPDPGRWPHRADLRTLAKQTARALRADGLAKVRLAYDATLFTGPGADAQWEPSYVPDGVVSPITSLWVDQGRDESGWGRVAEPSSSAAELFAAELRRQGVTVVGKVSTGVAGDGVSLLASAQSPTLAEIVERIIEISDNEAAEVVARHVGLARLNDGSSDAAERAITETLTEAEIDLAGAEVYDGSGLSRQNLIPTRVLGQVVALAASEAHPELRPVLEGLPVSGATGSLTYRFEDAPVATAGQIRAKTGTLTGVSGLAGIISDADQTPLVAVLVADRIKKAKTLDARAALDDLATALAECHCSGG